MKHHPLDWAILALSILCLVLAGALFVSMLEGAAAHSRSEAVLEQ